MDKHRFDPYLSVFFRFPKAFFMGLRVLRRMANRRLPLYGNVY